MTVISVCATLCFIALLICRFKMRQLSNTHQVQIEAGNRQYLLLSESGAAQKTAEMALSVAASLTHQADDMEDYDEDHEEVLEKAAQMVLLSERILTLESDC